MSARKKQDDQWWEYDRNNLDNDIEQLSKTTGGSGCLLAVIAVLALPSLATLFAFVV